MNSQPLIIRTCRHLLDNGRLCQCAANRGISYCRHHLDSALRRRTMARARRQRQRLWMAPLLAVQSLRGRSDCLAVAIEAGDLDLQTAWTLLSLLRLRDSVETAIKRNAAPRGAPSPSNSIKYQQAICF